MRDRANKGMKKDTFFFRKGKKAWRDLVQTQKADSQPLTTEPSTWYRIGKNININGLMWGNTLINGGKLATLSLTFFILHNAWGVFSKKYFILK